MKIKGVFLAAILTAVLCISGNLLAYSGDGDGTTGNPYQIADVNNFQQLSDTPTDWSLSFILTANLDFGEVAILPVGNSSIQFTGVFDGNSHTISNLTYTASTQDYIGLFGYVGIGGQIRNLGVEDVNITGREYVGGLVGVNAGTLTSCYATGSVSGADFVGGLVGYNYSGTLTACYATGSVTGTNYYVGGLVGWNDSGTLTGCYATGSVSGDSAVGGLVGYNIGGTLTGCYATGSVSGTDAVGGLVGYNEGGTVTDSFWDMETSKLAYSAGGTGKTTTEMMTLSTFTSPPASWDFSATDGDAADWMMLRPGEDYPRLIWQEIFSGDIAGLYGVDNVDLEELTSYWLQSDCPTGCEDADIDNSGYVDFVDFAIIADNWLAGI
jgi:hypothetical protein